MTKILLGILIILLIWYNIKAHAHIRDSYILTKTQKVLNHILIWLFPFGWYYIAKDFFNPNTEVMVKKTRDKIRSKKNNGDFYESGIGGSGP